MLDQAAKLLPPEFEVAEMLSDGKHLRAVLACSRPDLIVLDITLPGLSGIDLARQLIAEGCRIPIVFLTVHADPDYAREALSAGGLGYVVKPRLGTDLLPALRAALAGLQFISPCSELQEFESSFSKPYPAGSNTNSRRTKQSDNQIRGNSNLE